MIARWKELKEAEKICQEERRMIEKKLYAKYGQGTHEIEGEKVVITPTTAFKVDEKKWLTVRDSIPEELWPIKIVEKTEVEKKGVNWLKENEPGYWKIVAEAVTEKENKPKVEVK